MITRGAVNIPRQVKFPRLLGLGFDLTWFQLHVFLAFLVIIDKN